MHSEEFYLFIVKKMEEKLIGYMGPDSYDEWSTEVAKGAFRKEVEAMENDAFKSFILENFDLITADEEDKNE